MKNLIFTSIVFLFFSIANGEIVEKIEINGNKRVSTETIKLYGDIETKKDYQDRDLKPKEDLFFTITLFPLTSIDQKIDQQLYN